MDFAQRQIILHICSESAHCDPKFFSNSQPWHLIHTCSLPCYWLNAYLTIYHLGLRWVRIQAGCKWFGFAWESFNFWCPTGSCRQQDCCSDFQPCEVICSTFDPFIQIPLRYMLSSELMEGKPNQVSFASLTARFPGTIVSSICGAKTSKIEACSTLSEKVTVLTHSSYISSPGGNYQTKCLRLTPWRHVAPSL